MNRSLARLAGRLGAVILDFDGVVADSELVANTVLAEFVTALGRPMTAEESLDRVSGRRWVDAMKVIEAEVGAPLPADFSDRLQAATLDRFASDLQEVPGAGAFIAAVSELPLAIASSSSSLRLKHCLSRLNLTQSFGDHVFSADMVRLGKPHPDIFLLAAERLGVAPEQCLVVEDGVSGATAAAAAGMTVIGLCAASHIRPGHAQALERGGAGVIAFSWAEVQTILSTLRRTPQ